MSGRDQLQRLSRSHAEETRAALIAKARELFATVGFQATSLDDIARGAGLTKGALYHHFDDKEDLFRIVCEEVAAESHQRLIALSGAGRDPWERLRIGCEAFLDSCAEDEFRQILLLDGPAVLGLDALHEIGSDRRLRLIVEALGQVFEGAPSRPVEVKPLAQLLGGALRDGGLAIARADAPLKERERMTIAIDWFLSGLQARSNR
jgi:AcrR family transcriptional regulator